MTTLHGVAAVAILGIAACGSDSGRDSGSGIPTVTGASSPDQQSDTNDDADSLDDGVDETFGEGSTSVGPIDTGETEECAAVSEQATTEKLPVDVIFAVDNSGSMGDEAGFVQVNMNGFSSQIVNSGIDVHVVLISSYPGDGNGICIDSPLGGGGCPNSDTNPPGFVHVNREVGSGDSLLQIVNTHGLWKDSIRPESVKHIVVVSDDNSGMPGFVFHDLFVGLDPSYDPYVFHGIVALHDCSIAADVGQVYINLANETGGVLGELCDQSFQPVFDELSTEVIANTPINCSWEIPAPPDGEEFDPDRVNVEFSDGINTETIGAVAGVPDCPNVVDGWFYDNPAAPTRIHVCPQTCERIQAAEQARVDISFGCATVEAPPVG